MQKVFLLSLLYFLITSIFSADGTKLIIANNCKDRIWPAILGTAGHEILNDGGFSLNRGQQTAIEAPARWSDRRLQWPAPLHGHRGQPPATVVEMTLGTDANPLHYYDVSLVDGFNLPVSMIPVGGGGGPCGAAACEADVNACCPESLEMRRGGDGEVVGCKSACLATGADKYCCTGEYGDPRMCKPTASSNLFKALCPRAYSYAYDEASGLKMCRAKRYVITFCPPN
ncbi:hypothetical protein OROMI_007056 [Orobanche minor]